MLYWCSSTLPCYDVLVFVNTSSLCSIGTSWLCFVGAHRRLCFLVFVGSFVLLVLVNAPWLCFVGVHPCLLAMLYWCSLDVLFCWCSFCNSLVVFCWCSSMPPCCALLVLVRGFILLVFIRTSLMCFVGAHLRLLVVLY